MKLNSHFIVTIAIIIYIVIFTNCINNNHDASIEPTKICISVKDNELLVGGEETFIMAQLYYNGKPFKEKDANITFTIDNNLIATLPKRNYNLTDDNGTTYMRLFSYKMPGRVKITASYNDDNGTLSNSTYLDVYRWGSIAGLALDTEGVGIPEANVTLWNCHYNESSRQWENDNKLKIEENPQLTNDGHSAPAGLFVFYLLKVGTYNISVEKSGRLNSSIVTLEQGTATYLITLPDYKNNGTVLNAARIPSPPPTFNGGTIWGIICNQNRVSLMNADVSLWHCDYNQSTGQWEKTIMVDMPENPRLAGDGKTRIAGEYRFDNVPQGTYYVYADKEGHEYYAIVHLDSSLAINFVALPTYVY